MEALGEMSIDKSRRRTVLRGGAALGLAAAGCWGTARAQSDRGDESRSDDTLRGDERGEQSRIDTSQDRRNAQGLVRALIVDGNSNHDWRYTTRILRSILEESGGFAVETSTAPPAGDPARAAWRPNFAGYDVVIQNYNNLVKGWKERWPAEVEADFAAYVRNGGGVVIHHSANNAFRGWAEYDRIIGLGWRPPADGVALEMTEAGDISVIPVGVGPRTSHGPRKDALVLRRGAHPIHAGLPDRWMTPRLEIYDHARGPAEETEVISYAFSETTGSYWPVEWVVTYGRGRVYNSSYGHVMPAEKLPVGMRCAAVQTLLVRAALWAARRPVPAAPPADFPNAAALSLRDNIPSR